VTSDPSPPVRRSIPRPTGAAWRLGFLLLGLAAAAVNTGNNLVYLIASLLAASMPISLFVGSLNLRRLRYRIDAPTLVQAGTAFEIEIKLTHPGRGHFKPRALELTLECDGPSCGPLMVERVEADQAITLRLPAQPRGSLRLQRLVIRSTFPFGFLRHELRSTVDQRIWIAPERDVAAPRPTQIANRESPDTRNASRRFRGSEYLGLRRGRPEDDSRHVDWKVTARRGTPFVRESGGTAGREVHARLRLRYDGDRREARQTFERELTRVAELGRSFLPRGGCLLLAVGDESERRFEGHAALPRLLRLLAELIPTDLKGVALPTIDQAPDARPAAPETHSALALVKAHRSSASLALAAGCAALFVVDGISSITFGVLLLAMLLPLLSTRFLAERTSIWGRLWQVAAVIALVAYLFDILAVRRDPLNGSLNLTVFITLFVVFNARDEADDRRKLMISFLYVVLAAAMTTEIALALPLIAWVAIAVHTRMAWSALTPTTRMPLERRLAAQAPKRLRFALPTLNVTAATLVVTLAIFMIIPHFGTGAFRPGIFRSQAMTGMSDSATLGDIGRIKLNTTPVMAVRMESKLPPGVDLRWRAVALNDFDGRTWTRSNSHRSHLLADSAGRFFPWREQLPKSTARLPEEQELRQEIRVEPGVTRSLLTPPGPQLLFSRDFRLLAQDEFGNLDLLRPATRRLRYQTISPLQRRRPTLLRADEGVDPPFVLESNLALPDLDPRIPQLARTIVGGATTRYDQVAAIESWLSTNLEYSLDIRMGGARDPLAAFLFDGIPAHCEFFASAMAVMTRSIGIPTRFVAGYVGGEQAEREDVYVVRQSNAHAWVEIHFPEQGWVTFDPTPPAGRLIDEPRGLLAWMSQARTTATRWWDDYLVGIDLDDQARGLLVVTGSVRAWVELLRTGGTARTVAGGLLLLAIVLPLLRLRRMNVRRRQGRPADGSQFDRAPGYIRSTMRWMARKGVARKPGETALEWNGRAATLLTPLAQERLQELTRLYYRVRFDNGHDERSSRKIARALFADVRSGLRRG